MRDRTIEKVVDLKSFITAGYYGGWLGLAEDNSPVVLHGIGTSDVYSLDWKEP
jgi:hypothetical protein